MVQSEAQAQEQSALENTRGDGRVADGAQQDGVVPLDGLKVLIGEGLPGLVPSLRSQIESGRQDRDSARLQRPVENLEPLGDDLLANAVARNYCQLDGLRHEVTLGHGHDARQEVHIMGVWRIRVSTDGRLVLCSIARSQERRRHDAHPPSYRAAS